MTRVLIVEDQRTSQELLKRELEQSKRYKIEGIITDAGNAYLYSMTGKIDLILMDVYTLDGENGIEAAGKIKKDFPQIKIIIITSMPEESFIKKARQAGCESFWYKEYDQEPLLSLMDKTMAGQSLYPKSLPEIKIGQALSTELSPREMDVLRELVNGKSQKEISKELDISYDTTRTHIKNLLSKTGFESPNRLVAEVSQKRLIIADFFKKN